MAPIRGQVRALALYDAGISHCFTLTNTFCFVSVASGSSFPSSFDFQRSPSAETTRAPQGRQSRSPSSRRKPSQPVARPWEAPEPESSPLSGKGKKMLRWFRSHDFGREIDCDFKLRHKVGLGFALVAVGSPKNLNKESRKQRSCGSLSVKLPQKQMSLVQSILSEFKHENETLSGGTKPNLLSGFVLCDRCSVSCHFNVNLLNIHFIPATM